LQGTGALHMPTERGYRVFFNVPSFFFFAVKIENKNCLQLFKNFFKILILVFIQKI